MKKIFIILFLVNFSIYSQISVGARHTGKPLKFKKGILKKFKESKTIFIFSDVFSKEIYEKILKDSWNVNPYEIISVKDFDIVNYLDNKHSFATLDGYLKTVNMGNISVTRLYFNFTISMYEAEKLKEKISNGISKNKSKIYAKYEIPIAQFSLFPKFGSTVAAHTYTPESFSDKLFTEDLFLNYQPGFLKNYFQKINSLLKNETLYWKYQNSKSSDLAKLKSHSLYIAEDIKDTFHFMKKKNRNNIDKLIKELFSNYNFNYKFISSDALNNKILNNEDLFYLRFVRVSDEKFIQIINSMNGNIVYSDMFLEFLII